MHVCFIQQCTHVTGTEAHTRTRETQLAMVRLCFHAQCTDRHVCTNSCKAKTMNVDIRTTTLLKHVHTDSQTALNVFPREETHSKIISQ